jgi:predicted small secreted protein
MKKLVIALFAAAVLVSAVTGCRHTAQGMGKDMENAGEKIQDKTR